MQGILLTISNGQLKESLDKLQTKVDSLETVKELQDKVISIQEHQVSFLNDSIANMWQPIAIVAGLTGLIITGAFAYVTYLNRQAQKKIEKATIIIDQSNEIAIIAQEKVNELIQKQLELNEFANKISTYQRVDIYLKEIKLRFDTIERSINEIRTAEALNRLEPKMTTKESYDIEKFENQFSYLRKDYIQLSLNLSKKIVNEEAIQDSIKEKIQDLLDNIVELFKEFSIFRTKFYETRE
ncbi:hypothetical protein COL41_29235 [Bacillus mycoides]|uniref:hypothetical protein n=1 Tax=Bacillus mycoides TaxID=1405 RepID=UPI000BF449D0|nr:hypothetical protein [Bacillus mycoides]PFX88245.1 hypothetical protein COL41_29235 [Bacillus mycoides]QWH79141.1 hypothetical protein EXW59_21620 [Bacillus mycoides]QWI44189.1 hypothetical protein EXW55_14875 [Bacillus mycoides]